MLKITLSVQTPYSFYTVLSSSLIGADCTCQGSRRRMRGGGGGGGSSYIVIDVPESYSWF
jgi:hypothetical protein